MQFSPLSALILVASTLVGGLLVPITVNALDCQQMGELARYDSRCWEMLPPQSGSQNTAQSPGGLGQFQGTWQFDYDKTMEAYRQSPDYKPEEDIAELGPLLNLMFGMLYLKIDGNQLLMGTQGSDEVNRADCQVTSATANGVLADCSKDGDTKTLRFTSVVPGQYMTFSAIGEEECAHCMWRRVGD